VHELDKDDGRPYTLCPQCNQKVDPGGVGVHYAVELQRVDTFGATDYIEGMGGFFHQHCSVLSGWRSKPKPE
jgi:hypothetical protein